VNGGRGGLGGALSGQRSETVRRTNLSALVQVLHFEGPRSRSELVERTGLTRSAIRRLVGELVGAGLAVEEPGESLGVPGRPSPLVRLEPGSAVGLALEIAVDSLAMAVVGLGGHVFELVRIERPRERSAPEEVVADLADLAERAASLWRTGALVGVGVAVVGVARRQDGFVSTAPNLDWRDVPLGAALAKRLGVSVPVVVANEADVGALAEHRRGAAAGTDNAIFLSGEVGVGGGIIADGKPLTGVAGYGGEVGHLPVNPLAGARCRCGSVGCWETEVGEGALLVRAGRPADGGSRQVEAILADAAAGDPTALGAIDEVGRWLAIGIAGLVNTFNPARVVLGGRFALLHRFFAATVEDGLTRRALAAPRALVEVVPAMLGADAPLLGAAELAFEPILGDPASWFSRQSIHTQQGGTATMNKLSRIERGPLHAKGDGMHINKRRTAALVVSAALVFVACGDDDDSAGGTTAPSGGTAAGTTAAPSGTTAAPSGTTAAPSGTTVAPSGTTAAPSGTTSAGGTTPASGSGGGGDCVVGVSWNNYQEERWAKWDEPAIKEAVEAGGGSYISNDAKSSAETQASNVENLISQGANVLIILAQDGTAIKPSVAAATAAGVPVVAYDRLIEDPGALYVTFDNVKIGELEAQSVLDVVDSGNFVIIKGNSADANADFLRDGYVNAGIPAEGESSDTIKIVGETYTDNWDPALAQTEMEQFLTENNNEVDAVLSENDGMAGGVIAALESQGLAGKVAVSGQDGDQAALNRVALGTQTVDVWKDARLLGKTAGEAAAALCQNPDVAAVSGTAPFTTPGGVEVSSILLQPQAITQDNLDVVLDAGWIDEATLCQGVEAGSVAACG
jgi:D-xylose transport system substrate-binding protein